MGPQKAPAAGGEILENEASRDQFWGILGSWLCSISINRSGMVLVDEGAGGENFENEASHNQIWGTSTI